MSKYSNWREDLVDLVEVGNVDVQSSQPETEDEFRKEITAKKVKNKVIINPIVREAFEEIGGEVLAIYVLEEDKMGGLYQKRAREEMKIARTDMAIAKEKTKIKPAPGRPNSPINQALRTDKKLMDIHKMKEENEEAEEYIETIKKVKKAENEADRQRWGVEEACWKGYKQKGMKKKGDRTVPNCVREEEDGDKDWIQKATKNMRKDKPCTGKKFGSASCPPGSKRYNLAKTFKKMAKEEVEQIDEVSPPGWGHTKAEKEKTKPNKPKSKVGGSAAAFKRALDDGRFKGLPGDKTYKDKEKSMFKLMWSMKKKGDKPHYKPGTDKKKKQYRKDD